MIGSFTALVILILLLSRTEKYQNSMEIIEMDVQARKLNKVCFTICVASVVAADVPSFGFILEGFCNKKHTVVKKWVNKRVFFGASLLVGIINNIFAGRLTSSISSKSSDE